MDYHAKSFDTSISKAELAEAAAEYKAHDARLTAAKSKRSNLPKYFQYSGIAFAMLGAAFYVAETARSSDE